MLVWKIVGKNKNTNKTQELDAAKTVLDAMALLAEYRLAYGKNWSIDIVRGIVK